MTTATAREATHFCPAPRCPRQVPMHLFACGVHWRTLPPAMRHAITAAYAGGRGLGSRALVNAQAAAVKYLKTEAERTADDA